MFLHTYTICLSSIHPSFKYWLRDRLIGLTTWVSVKWVDSLSGWIFQEILRKYMQYSCIMKFLEKFHSTWQVTKDHI